MNIIASSGNPKIMFKMIENKIVENVNLVLEKAKKEKTMPRIVALKIAEKRIEKSMKKIR